MKSLKQQLNEALVNEKVFDKRIIDRAQRAGEYKSYDALSKALLNIDLSSKTSLAKLKKHTSKYKLEIPADLEEILRKSEIYKIEDQNIAKAVCDYLTEYSENQGDEWGCEEDGAVLGACPDPDGMAIVINFGDAQIIHKGNPDNIYVAIPPGIFAY